jgi:hypothetical protein
MIQPSIGSPKREDVAGDGELGELLERRADARQREPMERVGEPLRCSLVVEAASRLGPWLLGVQPQHRRSGVDKQARQHLERAVEPRVVRHHPCRQLDLDARVRAGRRHREDQARLEGLERTRGALVREVVDHQVRNVDASRLQVADGLGRVRERR